MTLSRDTWSDTDAAAAALAARFDGLYRSGGFDYLQPLRLQREVPARLRKPYATPVAYTEWGPADAPLVVCVGGVASSAARFSFLAEAMCARLRVVCMDWVGRGRSGWLADDSEYGLPTYVEQLRQLLDHLQAPRAMLLGSSMGGSAAMAFAARHPRRVSRLVLNDVGPSIPRQRRARRAEALARFYVFRTPAELMRRVGASQKHDGPMSEATRLFLAYQHTRWSPENAGRTYRHDLRALLAYQRDAQCSLQQWDDWARLRCPVLLLHGELSDALLPGTIARMRRSQPVTVAHIAHTGHAPALVEPSQAQCILQWLLEEHPDPVEVSIP